MYNDNDVTKDLVAQTVQDQLKALGIVGDEDNRKAEAIKLTLGGQEYTFASQDEMQATLNNAFSSVAQNQSDLMRQLEEASANQNYKGNSANSGPELDKDKFIKLINEDPIAAFNYMDELRASPAKAEQETRLRQVESNLIAYRFIQTHPEFQNTDDNALKLRSIASNLGLGVDFNSLESAYTVGKSYGIFGQQQNVTQTTPQPRFGNESVQAPPSINRGGNQFQDSDVQSYVETLSNDQLRQIMERGI